VEHKQHKKKHKKAKKAKKSSKQPGGAVEAGLWIRMRAWIRFNLSCWIRIRIQEGKNDLQI
jgi:hypothetical protein